MVVRVDEARFKGRAHMVADSLEELHSFASRIGVKRCWYERGGSLRIPHYDVTSVQRDLAILSGAVPVNTRDIIRSYKEKNSS